MGQNQPTLRFLHSCFPLEISQARSHQDGPKNMEIGGDYIPGYKKCQSSHRHRGKYISAEPRYKYYTINLATKMEGWVAPMTWMVFQGNGPYLILEGLPTKVMHKVTATEQWEFLTQYPSLTWLKLVKM